MKIISIATAVALALGLSTASATMVTQDNGEYTITYEDSTVFGGLSSWFSSGDTRGFSWAVPDSVQVVSFGGAAIETAVFDLPSFTITANPGWTLSGPGTAFLGNLVFTELGGATTNIIAMGDVSVDGSPAATMGGNVGWTATASAPGYLSGYFGDTLTVPAGNFSTASMSNASITLSATGGSFSSIVAQPQNKLEFSFTAVPVPEPGTYAMLLAGLAAVGWVVRQRNQR